MLSTLSGSEQRRFLASLKVASGLEASSLGEATLTLVGDTGVYIAQHPLVSRPERFSLAEAEGLASWLGAGRSLAELAHMTGQPERALHHLLAYRYGWRIRERTLAKRWEILFRAFGRSDLLDVRRLAYELANPASDVSDTLEGALRGELPAWSYLDAPFISKQPRYLLPVDHSLPYQPWRKALPTVRPA